MTRTVCRALLFALALPALCAGAAAADIWVGATDPAVVTNNDCGQIAAASGQVRIHRSFHLGDDEGVPANVADRLSSGDELITSAGAHVEWITGANTVAVLGAGGRARFEGLRTFKNADGKDAARLDVTLLAGELRVQVRLNETRPESVLAGLAGADFLLTRGDAALFAGDGWRGSALDGSASARLRRGAVPGVPFVVDAATAVGVTGIARVAEADAAAIRARVPFSFETARAALPPLPAMSAEDDAP